MSRYKYIFIIIAALFLTQSLTASEVSESIYIYNNKVYMSQGSATYIVDLELVRSVDRVETFMSAWFTVHYHNGRTITPSSTNKSFANYWYPRVLAAVFEYKERNK